MKNVTEKGGNQMLQIISTIIFTCSFAYALVLGICQEPLTPAVIGIAVSLIIGLVSVIKGQ
ncbi:hypothetical protein P9057_08415 [Gallibacterium anatis]|uniref:hypothetical protein n=1 Tax=Gallibacterium anatis TaxID=750 RepID=UPI003007BB6C